MNAPLGFLFPDREKPVNRRKIATIRFLASGATLTPREKLMMKNLESSMWLDRREVVATVVEQRPHAFSALVAAVRQFVARMQLGPVGGDERLI